MSDFVWAYARRGSGDDLITLIGDTAPWSDGRPSDDAAWDDWTDSLDWIMAGNPPRTGTPRTSGALSSETVPTLTSREGFLITAGFLLEYGDRVGDHLLALLDDIAVTQNGEPAKPGIWHDWLANTEWIVSGKAPKNFWFRQ